MRRGIKQKKAEVRVCACCEWIFRGPGNCPKCDFASYGARWVYGPVCYDYEKSQTPWKRRKMETYERRLLDEIRSENDVLFKTKV